MGCACSSPKNHETDGGFTCAQPPAPLEECDSGPVPSGAGETAAEEATLSAGDDVLLINLVFRNNLNGQRGSIESYDASKQRYVVHAGRVGDVDGAAAICRAAAMAKEHPDLASTLSPSQLGATQFVNSQRPPGQKAVSAQSSK